MFDVFSSVGDDVNFQWCLSFVRVIYSGVIILLVVFCIGLVLFGVFVLVLFDFSKYSLVFEIDVVIIGMKMIGGMCVVG